MPEKTAGYPGGAVDPSFAGSRAGRSGLRLTLTWWAPNSAREGAGALATAVTW